MIVTLLKIAFFIAVITGVTLGLGFIDAQDTQITMTGFGWEISPSPIFLALMIVVIFALTWVFIYAIGLFFAILRLISGDETAVSRYLSKNRNRKGQAALRDALIALAAGEGKLALKHVQRAEKYLDIPEATQLIAAQTHELLGNNDAARAHYKQLASAEKTQFIGLRGLLRQTLAAGETEKALLIAQKALSVNPRHKDVQDILIKLQSDKGDWSGARNTLGAQLRSGTLPRDIYRRREAVLALQEAKTIFDDTADLSAREAAIEANRLSPDLIPAAIMASQALCDKGKKRTASRILIKAWGTQPHPDLAAAFAEIEPDETPQARLHRFNALTRQHPEHKQTRLLSAQLLIAAEDFPAARKALGALPEKAPDQQTLSLMAAIERGSGAEEDIVRGWLAKAVAAPRGPQWCCDKCHAIHADWQPICYNCDALDTLSWTEVTESLSANTQSTAHLPLFIKKAEE